MLFLAFFFILLLFFLFFYFIFFIPRLGLPERGVYREAEPEARGSPSNRWTLGARKVAPQARGRGDSSLFCILGVFPLFLFSFYRAVFFFLLYSLFSYAHQRFRLRVVSV